MNYKRKFPTLVAAATLVSAISCSAFAASLTVYSPQGEDNVVWIKEQAAISGHDVEFLRAGGGDLFARLMAEKNNPQADVVLGMNNTSMARLKAEGMFQKHIPSWAEGLPEQYRGKQGMVHNFWQTPIVIAYNAAHLNGEESPKSWTDLPSKFSGQYVIGSIKWGTTRVILSGLLSRFADENGNVSDEGWAFMQEFYDNALQIESGEERLAALTKGDVFIDTNWFGGAFRAADKVGYNPILVDAEGGSPIVSEGIAVMAATDSASEAKAFVDWFGSPKFMAAYAEKFGQMPAHPEAIANSPQKVKNDATLISAQPIDWDVVAKNLDGWLQKIELEIK